jgi:hypothetical protein
MSLRGAHDGLVVARGAEGRNGVWGNGKGLARSETSRGTGGVPKCNLGTRGGETRLRRTAAQRAAATGRDASPFVSHSFREGRGLSSLPGIKICQ